MTTEQRVAELIADRLRKGLIHPGDPDREIPPTPLKLPFGPAPGRPPEMEKLLDRTVTLLSEAIIHTIIVDGDCEITPRAEAKSLRIAAGDKAGAPNMVPIHCHCDRVNPLAVLTVTDPDNIVVDGRTLLSQLARREAKCPHKVVDG